MLTIPLRTLRRRILIHAPDEASASVLSYIRADPRIEGADAETVDIEVRRQHGFLHATTGAGRVCEGSAAFLLGDLHRLHLSLTQSESPGAPLIHGGTLDTDKGFVVFVGEKGAGKTTLLLHLAEQGWPVVGDEHLIVGPENAIPRPRSLRVKAGTLPYLSEAGRRIVEASPSTTDWQGSKLHAVEPSAFGRDWVLRPRPIRAIFMLRAYHGAGSSVRVLTRNAALQLLLPQVLLPETGRAQALGWLARAVSGAQCFELRNGRLEESRRIIYAMMSDSDIHECDQRPDGGP